MSTSRRRAFRKLAVIGAGNMGSGIAQKMATEGFRTVLVDLDDDKVTRGLGIIEQTLAQGAERKIFRPEQAREIRQRITGTSDWRELADADLVVEAVFEDPEVKRQVFERLDTVCANDTILATNTSSLSVTDLASTTRHPERVLGLHYFYHPAKNRLVEVVPGRVTDPALADAAWALQEQIGKTPIASADASGFVVNRFFVPWLNESVRLVEQGVADIPTIEQAAKKTFGVGLGPFELMNVTGVPIALHASTTLGNEFGALYGPSERLRQQVDSSELWPLDGEADESRFDAVSQRLLAVTFYIATALVDEKVGTIEDTDIGARVGLRWPRGPFEMINRYGAERAAALVRELAGRFNLELPGVLERQAAAGKPFAFQLVESEVRDGVATLTVNRPDALNALNEVVVEQLHAAFRAAEANDAVRGIVIAGSGKAFIAGADIRFFLKNMKSGELGRIVNFTRAGHDLLNDIDRSAKPVVARMHGLTLGGGLELALAADRIVASTKATMAFPETGIGIYPGLGGTQRTTRRIGRGLTRWLVFTGQMLSAEEALAIGLVDAVAPPDGLDDAVLEALAQGTGPTQMKSPPALAGVERFFLQHSAAELLAGQADAGGDEKLAEAVKQIAGKAPVALELAEKLIDQGADTDLAAGLSMELDHLQQIFSTEDAFEGLSTLGRKKPQFKGC